MFSSSESSEWLECWKRRRGSKEGKRSGDERVFGEDKRREGDH